MVSIARRFELSRPSNRRENRLAFTMVLCCAFMHHSGRPSRRLRPHDLIIVGVSLAPTFRGSHSVSATASCELRKAVGTSKLIILVPLIDLKSLERTRRQWRGDFGSAVLVVRF